MENFNKKLFEIKKILNINFFKPKNVGSDGSDMEFDASRKRKSARLSKKPKILDEYVIDSSQDSINSRQISNNIQKQSQLIQEQDNLVSSNKTLLTKCNFSLISLNFNFNSNNYHK